MRNAGRFAERTDAFDKDNKKGSREGAFCIRSCRLHAVAVTMLHDDNLAGVGMPAAVMPAALDDDGFGTGRRRRRGRNGNASGGDGGESEDQFAHFNLHSSTHRQHQQLPSRSG